ncbi:hypothetical protein GCM10011519_33400 [Marmoricola endophyticus]|uniref:DUF1023 domain-containing protein n=1 Tax=Marmoricola endophyticus TaxID=2040280 RepID=A0A917BU17_9ACTN|nr:alpha/beta hydrolase [Marmoricola endophyticus]GGF56804.1 hypothetical protein GCM10011519_33400 [Marmoricola endophyticus]
MAEFVPPDGDPGLLRAAAGNFRSIAAHFDQQATTIRTQAQTALDTGEWKGGHSLRFRAGADGVTAQAADAATSLGSVAETLTVLAVNLQTTIEEVEKCKRMAEHAEAEARHDVSRLDPDSPTFETARGATLNWADIAYWNYAGQAEKAKTRYEQQARAAASSIDALTDRAVPGGSGLSLNQIAAAVDASTGLDDFAGVDALSEAQAWAALESWTDPDSGLGTLLDGLNVYGATSMAPSAAAQWWSTLTPLQQMAAIRTNPELGNLDGVAYWARDLANRSQIGVYRHQLEQQLAALRALRPDGPTRDVGSADREQQMRLIEDKLKSLKEVARLAEQPDHHVVGLDLSHERAQAIIAQGDLDSARYTSVFTPGLTSTVQGMQDNDDDMRSLRDRGARNLVDAMSAAQIHAAGGKAQAYLQAQRQVATVTWLDYQAPQLSSDSMLSTNSVASSHTAKEGGAALADFYRGLHQSRTHGVHDDPHVLAMAHSYGTTVQGYAARHHGTGIDTAYFSESPGMAADSADDLVVPHGQVFYSEGDNDQVADARQFGIDPSEMPGVKHLETRAATDPTTGLPLAGVTKHPFAAYAADHTTSGYNQAKLLVDQQEDLIYGNDTDTLDDLRLRDRLDNPLTVGIPYVGPGLYALNKGFEALGD